MTGNPYNFRLVFNSNVELLGKQRPYFLCCFDTVHHGHLEVGKYNRILQSFGVRRLDHLYCFFSVNTCIYEALVINSDDVEHRLCGCDTKLFVIHYHDSLTLPFLGQLKVLLIQLDEINEL